MLLRYLKLQNKDFPRGRRGKVPPLGKTSTNTAASGTRARKVGPRKTRAAVVCGDCFRFAVQRALEMAEEGVFRNIVVVHGLAHNPDPGPHERQWFEHAWIEVGDNGRVYDWQMAEVSKIGSVTKEQFYNLRQPQQLKHYSPEQALALSIHTGHWGPWHTMTEPKRARLQRTRWYRRVANIFGVRRDLARFRRSQLSRKIELVAPGQVHEWDFDGDISKARDSQGNPPTKLAWHPLSGELILISKVTHAQAIDVAGNYPFDEYLRGTVKYYDEDSGDIRLHPWIPIFSSSYGKLLAASDQLDSLCFSVQEHFKNLVEPKLREEHWHVDLRGCHNVLEWYDG